AVGREYEQPRLRGVVDQDQKLVESSRAGSAQSGGAAVSVHHSAPEVPDVRSSAADRPPVAAPGKGSRQDASPSVAVEGVTSLAEPAPPPPGKASPAAPDLDADGAVPAAWKPGDVVLDLYEVKQAFEGGGMGLVYRVHHRGLNVDLAVKGPRPDY